MTLAQRIEAAITEAGGLADGREGDQELVAIAKRALVDALLDGHVPEDQDMVVEGRGLAFRFPFWLREAALASQVQLELTPPPPPPPMSLSFTTFLYGSHVSPVSWRSWA